jgi:effector-binding domain-containing protein
MAYIVSVKQVQARPIAAARAHMAARDIPARFRETLDKVWKFLGYYPHLRAAGRNVFLYRHDMDETGAMTIDFGVEVSQVFAAGGEVFCTTTPAGQAAFTTHQGPYAGLRAGHEAVRAWMAANGRQDGGWSWELYGDWNDDPKRLETEILYLLR